MTAQLALFTPGQRESSPAKRRLDRQRILAWFVAWQEGSADDAAIGLGMDVLVCRPRVSELMKAGCLERTDLPRRPTRHGGTAAILRVTELGRREYRGES